MAHLSIHRRQSGICESGLTLRYIDKYYTWRLIKSSHWGGWKLKCFWFMKFGKYPKIPNVCIWDNSLGQFKGLSEKKDYPHVWIINIVRYMKPCISGHIIWNINKQCASECYNHSGQWKYWIMCTLKVKL